MKILIFDIDRQGAAVIEVNTESGLCRYRPRVRGTLKDTVEGIVHRIVRERPDRVYFEDAGWGAMAAEEVRRNSGDFTISTNGTVDYLHNAKPPGDLSYRFFE